ncbi:MAG TPA: BatA domain-containing protein [Burkholderiales bacterium]|nr:BatA domain-containing protein [Burkholderiales bacterium]
MRFLALAPEFAFALLAGVALVIALLHLLKPPPRHVIVPSLLLWARVVRARKRPDTRRLITLLLALGAGLSIALALTRPEIGAPGTSAHRLALVLDNSPSMGARMSDGRSRWEHAIEQARALLERSSAATEITLLDTAGRLGVQGFVERDAAIAALDQMPPAVSGQARMPAASFLAGAQVHLFTDGVADLDAPPPAVVHAVYEPADNVAVTAFEARPQTQDPTHYEALVQVVNASPGDLRARLLITGGDRFSIAQDLDLSSGETVNATFDVSDFEGGVLGAAVVSETDALALDDFAYAVVPLHRVKRVLLVTPGNPALEDALRSLPGVRLAVVAPDRYPRAGKHDALVFDRFAPPEPPAAGALLMAPPERKWLAGQSTILARPRVISWNEDHAVTAGIAWRNLRLARAALIGVPPVSSDALVLASGSGSGALVTAGYSQARWIQVGFALQDSNFQFQPDFPVFLGNALSWVDAPASALSRKVGSVEVDLPGGEVRDGGGNPVAASPTERGVVFEAARADVYTVSSPQDQVLVVANVADPRYAQINRTRFGRSDAGAGSVETTVGAWITELWAPLLLLAGAFLLLEWTMFTRPRAV